MEFIEVIRAAEWLTTPGVLLLVLWLLSTGRLVTRREINECREDRDWWRNAAAEALELGQAATRGDDNGP